MDHPFMVFSSWCLVVDIPFCHTQENYGHVLYNGERQEGHGNICNRPVGVGRRKNKTEKLNKKIV